MQLDRRRFVAGAAALALGVPRAGSAQSPSPITLSLGWINNVEYAGLWIALERG